LKKKSFTSQYNTPETSVDMNYDACEFSILNSKKRRIGILGGTFNPVHLGHVKMGVDAHDEFSLSKVLFIPTARPPHKDNNLIERDVHRISMLDLAVNMPYMQISDIELSRSGVTYTIDTLNMLKKTYANDEFYYIIGSDTLFVLDKWKNFYDVLGLTNFIVFVRDDDNMRKIKCCMEFYNSLNNKCFYLATNPGLDISSTMIRDSIKNDADLKDLLDEKVIDYIKENEIYK